MQYDTSGRLTKSNFQPQVVLALSSPFFSKDLSSLSRPVRWRTCSSPNCPIPERRTLACWIALSRCLPVTPVITWLLKKVSPYSLPAELRHGLDSIPYPCKIERGTFLRSESWRLHAAYAHATASASFQKWECGSSHPGRPWHSNPLEKGYGHSKDLHCANCFTTCSEIVVQVKDFSATSEAFDKSGMLQ